MKSPLPLLALPGLSGIACAAVFTNNIVLSPGPHEPGLESDYALTIYQDPLATDPTTIFFNYRDSQLLFVNGNIDEGSDWYLASQGDLFSASTIANGDFILFTRSDINGFATNPIDVPVGTLFLGVNTGSISEDPAPYRGTLGWVALEANGSTLGLISSAVTYDAPGIIVGTLTTIPEPAATTLLGVLLCLPALCLRRQRRPSRALPTTPAPAKQLYQSPQGFGL